MANHRKTDGKEPSASKQVVAKRGKEPTLKEKAFEILSYEKPPHLLESTTEQLVLTLFQNSQIEDASISETKTDIGFRRNKALVNLVDLTIGVRRANSALQFMVSQIPGIQKEYVIEVPFWKWLMDYNSRNHKHLRSIIREMQKGALVVDGTTDETTERWGSLPLLGPAVIDGNFLRFSMDERLQTIIKDPKNAPFLSLRTMAGFTSNSAASLFDRLLNYADVGETDWLTLTEVKEWLDTSSKAEFKYLKRDHIDFAVDQINKVTCYEVGYKTKNGPGSKKVEWVRFTIHFQDPSKADDGEAYFNSIKEVYLVMRDEFGLSPKNLDFVRENRYPIEQIRDAIEFTRFAIQQKKVTRSVPGYFLMALRENLKIGTAQKEIFAQLAQAAEEEAELLAQAEAKQEQTRASIAQLEVRAIEMISEQAEEGMSAYLALSPEAKEELRNTFSVSTVGKLALNRVKMKNKLLTEAALQENGFLKIAFGEFAFSRLCKAKPPKLEYGDATRLPATEE
jgi:hypothetical protein